MIYGLWNSYLAPFIFHFWNGELVCLEIEPCSLIKGTNNEHGSARLALLACELVEWWKLLIVIISGLNDLTSMVSVHNIEAPTIEALMIQVELPRCLILYSWTSFCCFVSKHIELNENGQVLWYRTWNRSVYIRLFGKRALLAERSKKPRQVREKILRF